MGKAESEFWEFPMGISKVSPSDLPGLSCHVSSVNDPRSPVFISFHKKLMTYK